MGSNDDKDMTEKRGRALYRAVHRGTREMDFLLGKFAEASVQQMNGAELVAFEELLAFPDPELAGALIDEVGEFSDEMETLLERIRQFHRDKN